MCLVVLLWLAMLPVQAEQVKFPFVKGGQAATIVCDEADWAGVRRAAADLSDDVWRVTDVKAPLLITGKSRAGGKGRIVVGTIGKSRLIDRMVRQGKLGVEGVRGAWESYVIDVVDGNLVVAGSDKRGTIYGIYDLSQRIGVSPWYWWADAPVLHHDELVLEVERYVQPSPKVKYRGIFINDEWPSFGGWANNRFGGINSKMYATMFELLLRLKANYLWPAMWDSRFNEDDPLTPALADEYGIVVGTSHHEPMMRAHKEYVKRKDEVGPWDYAVNKERLDRFFREGMERNKGYDNLVTIGMRGDGDVAMGRGDDEENMRVLHDVIGGQRQILADIYGAPDAVPQLWAIFTEVQRYYDAGFTVPDDVTLLFCDNNWGYIRRTGTEKERNRRGGMGLYYHIDMNGGPWNDRWVNTSPLPRLREQLSLAYQTGLDRIWIINVGDLKPKELPIDFIMHYAWDPEAIGPGDEHTYLEGFASSIFGPQHAAEIADLLRLYPKYNQWRKAEVQVPGIFSPDHYEEADSVTRMWRSLAWRAEVLKGKIPTEAQAAYEQLVYYPVVASAGVAEIFNCATMNRYYARLGDVRANAYANRARELFVKDSLLTLHYNEVMADGKWRGMMQDKHIGYRQWSMPERNTLPQLVYVPDTAVALTPEVQHTAEYAIAATGYARNIPGHNGERWQLLPDLGRADGCMGIDRVTVASDTTGQGARLEYAIEVEQPGKVTIAIGIRPTQDVNPARGLRLGVCMDRQPMAVIDARRGMVDTFGEYNPQNIARSKVLKPLPPHSHLSLSGARHHMRNEVFDDMRWLDVTFSVEEAGTHCLGIVMVDPEVVVERIVVNPDNGYYSYFGPRTK